jgi:ankyrin repeat protein
VTIDGEPLPFVEGDGADIDNSFVSFDNTDRDLVKVIALLKSNPELVFSSRSDGSTPLHMAAIGGRKDMAELLLAKGAEVNSKDEKIHQLAAAIVNFRFFEPEVCN